ncbi:hypothetical protein ACFLZB_02220 [Nanoarchaeota archaeon]
MKEENSTKKTIQDGFAAGLFDFDQKQEPFLANKLMGKQIDKYHKSTDSIEILGIEVGIEIKMDYFLDRLFGYEK